MSKWQVVNVEKLPLFVGTNLSDLGRIRVRVDGELEYCDRVVWTYTKIQPPTATPESEM